MRTLLIVLSIMPICLDAQQIEIKYDYSSTEKILEIFNKGVLTDGDYKQLLEMHGTQAYLRKMSGFFSGIDEVSFKRSLEAAVSGRPLADDPFMFSRVVPVLSDTKSLLEKVRKAEGTLSGQSTSLLQPYTPDNVDFKVTVYMLIGVVGGAWTFDDSPDSFYVDLSSLKGDFDGLIYLSAHELYHLIQYRFMDATPDKDLNKVNYLLDQMVREGAASYVADFTKVTSSGSYSDFNKGIYERNEKRIESNFSLLETLLFQAQFDEAAKIEELYNIGLSGMYQSPLYFVAFHIIKMIDQYLGLQSLLPLLSDPNKLVETYTVLCEKYGAEDKELKRLSPTTLQILKQVRK